MSDSLAQGISIEHRPDACLVRISGVIETNFSLGALEKEAPAAVVIDLDGVQRINSYGVRQWSRAVRSVPTRYLALARCRPAIVMQLNMTTNFAGTGQVISIYLPYVCEACGAYREELLDVTASPEVVRTFSPPPVTSVCGEPTEFDDVPKAYLSYVARTPPAPPPPEVKALLARLG